MSDIMSGAIAGAILAFAALSTVAAVIWVFDTIPGAVIAAVTTTGLILGAVAAARRNTSPAPAGDRTRLTVIPGDDD